MVTTETWCRRDLFRNERWARLMIDTLLHYRGTAYLLHEFVIMPHHLHILLTPLTSLEKAVQFIKGEFSYRAKKELGSNLEVWQKGFADHRIRDADDYGLHVIYMRQNPVRKHLCERPEGYPYSSARSGFLLDDAPEGLKPPVFQGAYGAPEGALSKHHLQTDQPDFRVGRRASSADFSGFKQASNRDDQEGKDRLMSNRQRPMTNDQRLIFHA